MDRFLNFEAWNDDDDEKDYPELGKHFECQPADKRFKKRSHLSEVISEMYFMNCSVVPEVDTSTEKDKTKICQTLDRVLKPKKLSTYAAAVQRVRKQLLRKPRRNLRKGTKPQHRVTPFTECLYFKGQRRLIGRYANIRRNYLKQEIPSWQDEQRRRAVKVSEHLAINGCIQDIALHFIGGLHRYRNHYDSNTYFNVIKVIRSLKELQMEQYHQDRLLANEKLTEASVRTRTCLQVLMRLVIDYN